MRASSQGAIGAAGGAIGAIGAIVAIAGCNPVFGLASTTQQDAVPNYEAPEAQPDSNPLRKLSITQFTYDNPNGASAQANQVFAPLATDPGVRTALMSDPDLGPVLAYAADGTIMVPESYDGKAWRLVAQIDGVAQEWQWSVTGGAHITSAIVAENPLKPAIPAGSSFAFTFGTPSGAVDYKNIVVDTTGGWSRGHVIFGSSPTTYDYTPAGSIAPTRDHGDVELVMALGPEDTSTTGCRFPNATASESTDLVGGGPSASTLSPWNTTVAGDGVYVAPTVMALGSNDRLLSLPGTGATVLAHVFGYVVRGGVPSFDQVFTDASDPTWAPTRRSQMMELLACRNFPLTPPPTNATKLPFVPPPAAATTALDPAWYVEETATHTLAGTSARVVSSMQAINLVGKADGDGKNIGKGPVTFATPFATSIATKSAAGATIELDGGSDFAAANTLAIGGRTLIPVTWSYETVSGGAMNPDDVTVNVYLVPTTGALQLVRAIHVTGVSAAASIDASAFAAATSSSTKGYVLEIVGHNGSDRTKIGAGDYTGNAYPYSAANVFTYGFTVTP
jgi:hypothetical protein